MFTSALAHVAELVDALDLGSSIVRCMGSSPFLRTGNGAEIYSAPFFAYMQSGVFSGQ